MSGCEDGRSAYMRSGLPLHYSPRAILLNRNFLLISPEIRYCHAGRRPFSCSDSDFMLLSLPLRRVVKLRACPAGVFIKLEVLLPDMAVPRHHLAKGKQGRRRSHLALKSLRLTVCPHCKRNIRAHTVCKFCGYYKGREIVNVLARTMRKQEKRRAQKK